MGDPRTRDPESAADVQRLRRRVRELERALDQREQELATLLASKSFRLTAPLRWMRRMLTGRQLPVPALPARAEAPSVSGIPRRLRAQIGEVGANSSHRLLDLDKPLKQLLSAPVHSGRLARLSPGTECYLGSAPDALRVAALASRELREELSFDARITPLQREHWQDSLRREAYDFLLIESAWEPEGGWGTAFASAPASRRDIESLLQHCRAIKLPTVLWAREDAEGLERVAWLAAAVDRVYAIDPDGVTWFRRNTPDARVGLLEPAIQPRLYNPVRCKDLDECRDAMVGTVLVDGWWDLAGPWASRGIPEILGDRLRVLDSRSDYSWGRLQDNPSAAPWSLGVVTPLEKSALLRTGAAELFLLNGTGANWRRNLGMLRAAACGAPILSEVPDLVCPGLPAGTITEFRSVSGRGSQSKAIVEADTLAQERRAHLAMRHVMDQHSMAARLRQIASDLEIPTAPFDVVPRVAHLLVTMRPSLLPSCLERFRKDLYPNLELVIVIHGDSDALSQARGLLRPGEAVTVLAAGRERSLGDCLNMAAAHTEADVWMKLDDDDHYGPQYTRDLMLYRRMTNAPLFGKPPVFLHIEQDGQLYRDGNWGRCANLLHSAEQTQSVQVAGGTLGGDRSVLEAVPFSSTRRGGSDSEFVQRALQRGYDLVGADGFNFVRYRGADNNAHTWRVADHALRARANALGPADLIDSQAFI